MKLMNSFFVDRRDGMIFERGSSLYLLIWEFYLIESIYIFCTEKTC